MLKVHVIMVLSFCCLVSLANSADDPILTSPQQSTGGQIGFGAGLVIGTYYGGPEGGASGAVSGALFGHGIDRVSTHVGNDLAGPMWHKAEARWGTKLNSGLLVRQNWRLALPELDVNLSKLRGVPMPDAPTVKLTPPDLSLADLTLPPLEPLQPKLSMPRAIGDVVGVEPIRGTFVDELNESLKSRGKSLARALSKEASQLSVDNLKRWLAHPEDTVRDGLRRGEKALEIELQRNINSVKKLPLFRETQTLLLRGLLEEPNFVVCGEEYPGPVVWHVNGAYTTKKEAIMAGRLIAQQLHRRVHVLHNPTCIEPPFETGLEIDGFGDNDYGECAYDRLWPTMVASRPELLAVLPLLSFRGNQPKLQANPTTRQLAWVLYHADGPVSLVTHSQGCLIARNAFVSIAMLGKESTIRNDVAWVAAGIPLNDNEIWPRPKKTMVLPYQNDSVPKLIGLRGGGIECNGEDHDMFDEYIPRIQQSDVW